MNREHGELQPLLGEYIDGGLDDARAARLQAHLEQCAECLGEVEALLALQSNARALPREIAPSRDLWPEISARLQRSARPPVGAAPAPEAAGRVIEVDFQARTPRRAWRRQGWAAAAAVALVVASSATTAYLLRPGAPARVAIDAPAASVPAAAPAAVASGSEATPAAPARTTLAASPNAATPRAGAVPAGLAAFGPGEEEYRSTVESLQAELHARRDRLSPETVATIEKNLKIIDTAILEARAALEADPSSAELPLMLSGVYRTKVELLQRAVQLSART